MTREWYATCKDCGKEFGYSDASQQLSSARGLSRPERCAACRRLHSREIASLGLSHFELTALRPIPPEGLRPAELGGLSRPKRVHTEKVQEPSFDLNKFGIKDSHIREFCALSHRHQIMVVVAPTGSGKSTFFPYRLMVPPDGHPDEPFRSMLPPEGIRPDLFTRNGQIIVTQPRIQATRNIPAFVARDLHGSSLGAGFDIGFQHSGNPATDWRNKLVYMTDGSLINMIVRNEIGRLGVILIDEAHERSLNIDLILGLLKGQLRRFPRLKLIIASATIDTRLFLHYYGGPKDFNSDDHKTTTDDGDLYDNAAIAQALAGSPVGFYGFPGKRQFPVETRFREGDPIPAEQMAGRMPEEVARKAIDVLVQIHKGDPATPAGDILAFLHGKKPIERAVALIRELLDDEVDPKLAAKVDVLPLYTELPQAQQDAALKPKKDASRIRVVISTNVAETSLTVDGIVHVVESGLINESQWDPQTQTTYVLPKIHSQAGCKQRWGRGGRIQPGVAHCLYTEEQFAQFLGYTDPEIRRAPLEQIVLTAKAAGVSDLKAFDWIQRPSEVELDRAPRFLRDIGALDQDGDLTDHGMELRNFAEETDIANLMILADRFGCAVEMASLLPMRKLGGYSSLLLWDRGWDAPTKRSVRRIHQGLLGPCQDDLEFCLKLWEAWEGKTFGRTNNKERERWAQQFFVRHSVFKDQIAEERKMLLQSLSAHKKDDQARNIDFNLLTRIRIVMTFGLSNQIYRLGNRPGDSVEIVGPPVYQPYIRDPEANPDLVRLQEGAVIEVSPESICFGRPLELFVCGKRQRTRKRESPLADPVTFISAAFLTLIKPAWLQAIGQPHIAVARMIAAETRDPQGALLQTTTRTRLFIDQTYPVGATFTCVRRANGSIQIGRQEAAPPLLRTSKSYEDIEAPEDIEVLEAEGALSEALGADEQQVEFAAEEAETVGGLFETDEEEPDQAEHSTMPQPLTEEVLPTHDSSSSTGDVSGRIVEAPSGFSKATFNAVVVGYDLEDRFSSTVLLEVPISPAPFEQFKQIYIEGESITVNVEAVERYVNDGMLYLVVREPKSSLEIILDPYDASLIGRNFAINLLSTAPKGSAISVTIEEINDRSQQVRATRLKESQTAAAAFLGGKGERTVDAQIIDVRDNGLFLWLDPANTQDWLPVLAFARLDRLPQRPSEMSMGEMCRVRAQARKFKKPLRFGVSLDDLPTKERDSVKRRLGPNWQDDDSALTTNQPLLYGRRLNMLTYSKNPQYRQKVNLLFRRSNELEVRVIDITGIESLRPYQEQSQPVRAKVVTVTTDTVFVKTEDGYETPIPKREVVYDPRRELREEVQVDQEVEVRVKQIDLEQGRANLSMLDPAKHPLLPFVALTGQVVTGRVDSVRPNGARVELAPGALGFVEIGELAWWRVEDVTDIVMEGQQIRVQILSVDIENNRAALTVCLPENDPLRNYAVDQSHRGQVVGYTRDGFGVFVQLEPGVEAYLPRDEIAVAQVQNVRQALPEGTAVYGRITQLDREERRLRLTVRGLYEASIFAPLSHRGLLIGRNGSVIKELQRETSTYIALDDDGYCTIQAPDEQAVRRAEQQVRKILQTRIVTFTLDERQPGMLIGSGGTTIKGITQSTGAQIETNGREVRVIAADNYILQSALGQIREVVSYCSMIIQVASNMAFRAVGTGGETIKFIRSQSGVQRIDLEKDGSNRFTGRITIEAPSRPAADRARGLIEQSAGRSTLVRVYEGSLPQVTDVPPDAAPPQRRQPSPSSPTQISAPRLSRPTAPPAAPKPAPASTPPLKPTSCSQEIWIQPLQVATLTRKQGGFFTTLFGGGKSQLQKIQDQTGAKIEINATKGSVKITGQTEQAMLMAIQLIREAVG